MCWCVCAFLHTPRTRFVVDLRADLQSCASQRKMAQQRIETEAAAKLWGWGASATAVAVSAVAAAVLCCAATAAINSKAKNFIRNSKHIRRTDDVQRAENNEQSSDVGSSSDAKIQADSSPSTSWQQQKQQRKVTWRLPVHMCVCVSV